MISQLRLILSSSPFVSLKKNVPLPQQQLCAITFWQCDGNGCLAILVIKSRCSAPLCVRGWDTLCSSSIHMKDMRQPPKGHFTSHALNSYSGFQSSAPHPTLTSIPNTVKSFRLVMVNYKIPNALVLFTVHVFGIKLYYHAQKCF